MKQNQRLFSLDFYGGFTIFLFIAEFSVLFERMVALELEGSVIGAVGQQFQQVEWIGLYFWDFIQPFFVFINGVVMAWFDILISSNKDGGHCAMFNAMPTVGLTVRGELAGQLLISEKTLK